MLLPSMSDGIKEVPMNRVVVPSAPRTFFVLIEHLVLSLSDNCWMGGAGITYHSDSMNPIIRIYSYK